MSYSLGQLEIDIENDIQNFVDPEDEVIADVIEGVIFNLSINQMIDILASQPDLGRIDADIETLMKIDEVTAYSTLGVVLVDLFKSKYGIEDIELQ